MWWFVFMSLLFQKKNFVILISYSLQCFSNFIGLLFQLIHWMNLFSEKQCDKWKKWKFRTNIACNTFSVLYTNAIIFGPTWIIFCFGYNVTAPRSSILNGHKRSIYPINWSAIKNSFYDSLRFWKSLKNVSPSHITNSIKRIMPSERSKNVQKI